MKVSELLMEEDVEDVTLGVKKIATDIASGYKSVQDSAKEKIRNRKEAVSKLNEKELPVVRQMMKDFIISFFEKFPEKPPASSLQAIKKKITNRKAGKAAFVILKEVAADIEKVRSGINSAAAKIVPGGKKTVDSLADIAEAKGKPNESLANFMRKEVDFFRRLVVLDNDLQVDLPHAAQQLSNKMNRTMEERKTDAVMALNWILIWLHTNLLQYADEIAKATASLPEAD